MTWGQIRLQLQTSAPGVSLDLLDEFLNARYEQVLEATNWKGLKYRTTIETVAAYQSTTDTVTFTVGSTAVTGSGTTWTSLKLANQQIYRPGDAVVYTPTYVSGTSLTLDRPYEGTGIDAAGTVYAGAAYVFMQDIYPLPSDVRSIVPDGVGDPTTGFLQGYLSIAEMEASCGPRTLVETPTSYAMYDDSPEASPPVVHQIRFYPPPLNARGIPVEYVHLATVFDGSSTGGSPLPFVSNTVLLEGCRADIQLYLASQAEGAAVGAHATAAKGYELKFERELARLLLVEHAQRRKIVAMKMADRFTRHRLERANRGMNSSWRGSTPGGPN
jgi:hypothetical protein